MTLIELIISVLILALIIGPLTMVLEYAFASNNAASHRTTDSSGAQLMSSYFVADVQGADFVWTNDQQNLFNTAPFTTRCGTDGATRLEIQYAVAATYDPANPATATVRAITYDVVAPPAGVNADTAFARRTWSVSGGSCSKTDSTNLVDAVDTASLPTLVCEPVNCKSPDSIELTVDALSQRVHNTSLYDTYTFHLTATRRT